LGPFTQIVGSNTLEFAASPPSPGLFMVGANGDLRGEMILTTADGTLRGKYSGSFVRVPGTFSAFGFTPPPGTMSFVVLTAEVKFEQGTGGLVGVTGTAHFVALATTPLPTPTPSFTYTLAGTLNIPNKGP
jgi:hypothetical protein